MVTTATVTVKLSDEILAQAREIASEDKVPLDNVLAAAIGRYAYSRRAFEEMLLEGHEYGRQIGIRSEEDVEQVANGTLTLEQLRGRA